MLHEKANDCLARFGGILGARTNADHSALSSMGELVVKLLGRLQIKTMRCALDVTHRHLLTRYLRPRRDQGIARAFSLLIIVAGAHMDEHGRHTHLLLAFRAHRAEQVAAGRVKWGEDRWLGDILPQAALLYKFTRHQHGHHATPRKAHHPQPLNVDAGLRRQPLERRRRMRHRRWDTLWWASARQEHRDFECSDAGFLQRLCVEGATAIYPVAAVQNQHRRHLGSRAGRTTKAAMNLADLPPTGDFSAGNDDRLARSINRLSECLSREKRSSIR